MGTTTNLQITIYSCTSERVAAVVQILDRYSLDQDWGHGGSLPQDRITLGETYGTNYATGEASDEMAAELIEAAPELVFDTWTDPADEWLGSGIMYAPGLGTFKYEATADGEPQFSTPQIRAAMAEGPDAVSALLGDAWIEAIKTAAAELGQATGMSTIQSVPCPTCQAKIPCEVSCPLEDPDCKQRECDEHADCRRPRRKRKA